MYEGAHAASDDEESTLGFGDHYQDYYNQSYDDAQAGPDALTSLEPMKTTSFQLSASSSARRAAAMRSPSLSFLNVSLNRVACVACSLQ